MSRYDQPGRRGCYERPVAHSAVRRELGRSALVLGKFHFDFYKLYYQSSPIGPNAPVLAFGEIGHTVVLARHDDRLSYHDPGSYFVRQYDTASQSTIGWQVASEPTFAGQGDQLTQTLLLQETARDSSTATAKLTLGSRGNHWQSDSESGLLASSVLLSWQALHDLRLTEQELYEKLTSEPPD